MYIFMVLKQLTITLAPDYVLERVNTIPLYLFFWNERKMRADCITQTTRKHMNKYHHEEASIQGDDGENAFGDGTTPVASHPNPRAISLGALRSVASTGC